MTYRGSKESLHRPPSHSIFPRHKWVLSKLGRDKSPLQGCPQSHCPPRTMGGRDKASPQWWGHFVGKWDLVSQLFQNCLLRKMGHIWQESHGGSPHWVLGHCEKGLTSLVLFISSRSPGCLGLAIASTLQGRKWRPRGVESPAPKQTADSEAVVLGACCTGPQWGWTLNVLGVQLHLILQRQCCVCT